MWIRVLVMAVVFCSICVLSVPPAPADDGSSEVLSELKELRKEMKQLKATVEKQQGEIYSLQRENADLKDKLGRGAPAPAVPGAVAPPSRAPVGLPSRAAPSGLQAFNPEIGMIGDIVAQFSQSGADAEGNDKISVRELELIVAHDIDPYSRFDSTITLSDFEEVSVEEAYITHHGLPWEVKGRLGRIRPRIGKASAVHRDVLDTVDEPLVVQRYLGLEGLFRTALELSRFLPQFAPVLTQDVTVGVMEGGIGEGGTLFGATRRRPSFYAHLRNFFDISDLTNLELGATYLAGSSDADGTFEVNAIGADATLIHYFTPTNKLKWQNEVYLQDRREFFTSSRSDTTGEEVRADMGRHPLGFYSLLDYRLSPRFSVGLRGDYVQPVNAALTNPRSADTALSAYLTFHQSEFARWRVQAQHLEEADGGNDDRLMLQGTVAIGVHKHQLQ